MPTNWYNEYKEFIDNAIKIYLEKNLSKKNNLIFNNFLEIVYYSTKGGKRIRSILAIEFYLTFSNKKFENINIDDDIIKICVAIELLHAYSLVHDDLPSMDNDKYRRGEKSTWYKFGETNAILVGDLLNSLSFQILSSINDLDLAITIIKNFSKSVGFYGMIGGQILDLYYEKNYQNVTIKEIIETHNLKTGALISFSICSGILASGYKGKLDEFEEFSKNLGLAFQVKDDLIDKLGTFGETGKSVGGEKKGFVHLIGVEKSNEYLETLINECLKKMSSINSEKINFLINYVGNRKK